MLTKLRQKLSGAKGSREEVLHSQNHVNALLHIPDTVSNEELLAVQQLLALQAKLDQEILFESHCTFHSKSHYVVASKCSVRLYKSKKHWLNSKKKVSPKLSIMIYDSYAIVPEIPVKNTMQIRTTSSIFAIRLQDEDAVDNCIALINNQCVNQTNQEARFHFWKGKYTVHVFVTEIWDLPLLDSGSTTDPFVQVRVVSKASNNHIAYPKSRPSDGEDIIYSFRIRDRERNPVFNDAYTFLCVSRDDEIIIDLFDFDQWGKKALIGFVRINLSQCWGGKGLHGWFSILDDLGDVHPGNGYMHIKLAIFEATDSVDHISLSGTNFFNSRLLRLQGLNHTEPVSPNLQQINIFIGTWNVGNEPPPDDISAWIVRHNIQPTHENLQRAGSMGSDIGFQSAQCNTMDHCLDSLNEDQDIADPHSARKLIKADSAESITSVENDDSFGSLNDLKIRSRKPRNGVKSHPIDRSKYDRSPIEVPFPPGLYVIGAQECQYTPKNGSNCKDDWISTLIDHLGTEYILVDYSSLWQIRMAIFARKDLYNHISNVSVHKEATGIAHVLGNKGGVVVSFRMFQTWMCFVNCHLAAHQTKRDQRDQDIRDIITKSGLKVGNKQNDLACQFHYIWLLGDLNYRLDYGAQANQKSPTLQEFREMESLAQSGRFNTLFNFDQLSRGMNKKEILSEWVEGIYKFPPSFKVERHAGFRYNPARSPAWCDRILWKTSSEDLVHQKNMRICESIATSDHKPISSLFEVTVFYFDESKNINRGRAELLFTEVTMSLTDPSINASPVQFHLRFRSDCFFQNPIIQAFVDKPVRLTTPTTINISGTGLPEADHASLPSMDDAWLNAALFPVIKLKHNNLQRLKQHIISIDLLHFTGAVYGQGILTFDVFEFSEIVNLRTASSRASSFNLQNPSNQTASESAFAVSNTSLSPSSTTTAPTSSSNRRISQMVIRPSSTRDSRQHPDSMSEVLSKKSTSKIGAGQGSISRRSSQMNSQSEQSRSRITSSQLEQFGNVQSNASFTCDLASGTTSLGSLSGTIRLSWAS